MSNVKSVEEFDDKSWNYTDEEFRQMREEEEEEEEQERMQVSDIEKEEEKKRYDRSLEELRQQLTFTVDTSGEIHLVKRDPNNNNLHITRVSKWIKNKTKIKTQNYLHLYIF